MPSYETMGRDNVEVFVFQSGYKNYRLITDSLNTFHRDEYLAERLNL